MTLSFDEIARQFDSQRSLPHHALTAWLQLVDELAAGRALQVIEPGIGTGRIALPLAAAGHHITGSDISLPMLEQCRATARALGIADKVSLHQADATDLPVADHAFDLAVISQLLYLVPDWPTVLDELARVVAPGGHVMHVTEPTTEGTALSQWSSTWRAMIEATGYRHRPLAPTDDEVQAEFLRRWPDVRVRELANWSFGQSVAEARHNYAERLRPLYMDVPENAFRDAVTAFLAWSEGAFADLETRLEGTVTLTALIAFT